MISQQNGAAAAPAKSDRSNWLRPVNPLHSMQVKVFGALLLLLVVIVGGSTVGFISSATATRDLISSQQLAIDRQLLQQALADTELDEYEGGQLLAETISVSATSDEDDVLDKDALLSITDPAVQIRDRYDIDQIVVLDDESQVRINIAPSHLEALPLVKSELLADCTTPRQSLVTYTVWRLLVTCTPVMSATEPEAPPIAHVYTIIDVAALFKRLERSLDFNGNIYETEPPPIPEGVLLTPDRLALRLPPPLSDTTYQETNLFDFGNSQLAITQAIEVEAISQIMESGLRTMLIVTLSGTVIGIVAALLLTRRMLIMPLRRLTAVADKVAEGDFSERPHLGGTDEIGRLAQGFDHLIEQVASREANLRQQVKTLQIEIDKARAIKEVNQITDTAYFQQLREHARSLRNDRNTANEHRDQTHKPDSHNSSNDVRDTS